MRSFEVFRAMTPAVAERFFRVLERDAPGDYAQTLAHATRELRVRPVYLRRLSFSRRVQEIRRTLSRVVANTRAETLFATYFLSCRKDLLTAWLDQVGVRHEDGHLLDAETAEPEPEVLRQACQDFLAAADAEGADREDRGLLLRAFAAQSSIAWPTLEALLSAEDGDG